MNEFLIEFFNFALFVNRRLSGAVVLLPSIQHQLQIDLPNGTVQFPPPMSDIRLTGPAGAPLANAPTAKAAQGFLTDLAAAEGHPIAVPAPLLTGPVDPRLNGRVTLAGGRLDDQRCRHVPWNTSPYGFPAGAFWVTDHVRYWRDAGTEVGGGSCELWLNAKLLCQLPAGSQMTISNIDVKGGPPQAFADLQEYVDLCSLVGVAAQKPHPVMTLLPTTSRARLMRLGMTAPIVFGEEHVCASAQVDA